MRTRLARLSLWLGLLFFWPSFATAGFGEYSNSRAAVETAARATTQSALIYGGAIVLAGVAVGAGIYFGLRNKK